MSSEHPAESEVLSNPPFPYAPSASPEELLRSALARFGRDRLILATSFSIEDQVLTHMLLSLEPRARIFTLDTGRLFQETYDVQQLTRDKYGARIEVAVPDAAELAAFVSEAGPNAFYESIELRKRCCEIRKVNPLRRILGTVDAWVCGLRTEQSMTRTELLPVEHDKAFHIYKINPLWNWSEEQVWAYIEKNRVPFNALQRQGFRSVGCAPCTRPVKPEEDIRAGRWWWETPGQRECGLHRAASYAAKTERNP